MANQTGRPIAPARKLVAAVMGTLAVFVIVFGLGMSSWAVAIFGLVVLAIAVALAMVSNVRRGGRATVAGTAEILDITAPPIAGAYGRAEIRAIVVAPGLGTFDKVIRDGRVPVAKWPLIGSTVPITVDVDDTRRVRINWKDAADVGPAGDPPPPGQTDFDLGPDPADEAEDDDVLGSVAPGPWESRSDDWATEEPAAAYQERHVTAPVVVRDTPHGPIVEGQVVGGGEQAGQLPRRAGSGPRAADFDTAATDPVGFDPIDLDPPSAEPRPAATTASAAAAAPASPASAPGAPASAPATAPASPAPASATAATATGPADAVRSADIADQAGAAPATGRTATDRPGSGASSEAWTPAGYPPPPGPSAARRPVDDSDSFDFPPPPAPGAKAPPEPFDDDFPPPPGPGSRGRAAEFDYPPPPGPGSPGRAPSIPTGSDYPPPPRAAASSAPATDSRPPGPATSGASSDRAASGAPSGPATSSAPSGPATPSTPTGPAASGASSAPVAAAFAAGPATGAAVPTARAAGTRPPGSRPSPKRRSSTSTATVEAPVARPQTAPGRPPAQRTSTESTTDPDPVIDVPLDEPVPPAPTTAPERRPTHSGRTRFVTQPGVADTIPEPPAATSRPAPTPLTAPPTAPEPDRPFPTAPKPSTPRPTAPVRPVDDVDLPLDDNPDTPPEATAAADPAVAAGIVAPPAGETPASRDTPAAFPATEAPTTGPDSAPAAFQAAETQAAEPGNSSAAEFSAAPPDQTAKPSGSPWGDFSGRQEPDDRAAEVITAYPSARPGPAGAIHGVGITILVTDLARSIDFYRDTLGFYEIDTGDGSSVLASGDTRVVLRTVPNVSSEAGRLIYLNLEVGDIEAVHDELRAKGVKFVHSPRPVNRGDKLELWSATFRDPDNHNIAITQWRAIRPDSEA